MNRVREEKKIELYLGSTFGSCFGDSYRSTSFGHRYRINRRIKRREPKVLVKKMGKTCFFFGSVQETRRVTRDPEMEGNGGEPGTQGGSQVTSISSRPILKKYVRV